MRALILLSCLLSSPIWAAERIYDPTKTEVFDYKGKEWQESKLKIPAYPLKRNLIEFSVLSLGATNYKFYLDKRSVSLDRAGVVRYTAVITSGNVTNVFYDGIRCSKAQYKNYAYGLGNRFQLSGNDLWQGVSDNSLLGLRQHLFKNVVCDDLNKSRKAKHIISLLQNQ